MTDSKFTPPISPENTTPATSTTGAEVDAFLAKMRGLSTQPAVNGGRLIFALDATASRQPTWDTACQLQAEMFREAAAIGSLSVQLVYYRGLSECRASKWISQPEHLSGLMEKIDCRMGHTQLGKVLAHARREAELLKVQALIFVGDAFEENLNKLSHDAGELRRLSVPAFMFQEGHNRDVEQVFRGIARLTHGAYCRFDPGAARQLAELLRAVAVYAAGGMTALAARRDAGAVKLLSQMK
jgi:hypothetical protein